MRPFIQHLLLGMFLFTLLAVAQEPVALPDSSISDSLQKPSIGETKSDSSQTAVPEQQVPVVKRKKRRYKPPFVYVHALGGMGFSHLRSSDVEDIFDNQLDILSSLVFQWGGRAGFSNIAQIQYMKAKGTHKLDSKRVEVDLDYRTEEYLIKINPRVWQWFKSGNETTLFLVAGIGDVNWLDEVEDGFKGDTETFGVEMTTFMSNYSITFGFKRKTVTFTAITLTGVALDFDAEGSQWVLDMTFGFGFGR
ncbi:MAG: hypothetical protein ACRBF0_14200 [Calditrichia bacterium]